MLHTHGQGFSGRFNIGLVAAVRLIIVRRVLHLLPVPVEISGMVVVGILLHRLRVRIAGRIVERVVARGLSVKRRRLMIVRSHLLDGLRESGVRADGDGRAVDDSGRGGDVAHALVV